MRKLYISRMNETTGNPPPNTTFQKASFLIYLFVVTAGFLVLLRHFLLTIFMAAIFVALTYRIYSWVSAKTRTRYLASLLTLLGLVLMLIFPLVAVGVVAYQEAVELLHGFNLNQLRGSLEGVIQTIQERYPNLVQRFATEDIARTAIGWAQNISQFLLKIGAALGISAVNQLFNFFLMLFMMFYFYVDGPRIMERVIRWSPLKDEYEHVLINRFLSVSRGTLKGVLVIGVIQGFIGAVLFFAVGVGSPILLGVLIFFFSVLPAVGGGLVWLPVAVILMLQGQVVSGIIVIVVGAVIISSVDNVLRPVMVGKDIKMHDLLVLLSTIGGLMLFGLAGFVIGPVIAALFVSIWQMFEEVFAHELAQNRNPVVHPTGVNSLSSDTADS